MFIDLTLEVTPKLTQDAKGNESKANFGHLGTHEQRVSIILFRKKWSYF